MKCEICGNRIKDAYYLDDIPVCEECYNESRRWGMKIKKEKT